MSKVVLVFFLYLPLVSYANEFVPKTLDSFKQLHQFESVSKFETYVNTYVQTCIDNSFGGSLSVRCFVQTKLWDKELNRYYKLLYQSLDKQGKSNLKVSQRLWLKTQDETIKLNSYLLDKQFNNKSGTMYVAMRVGEASDRISPIIKERALLLKNGIKV
ncbi:lysozyme inhibitor LprI family protein [Sulfurimonas sp.]|uniref:lysozyme inhibitor LprI family protein n=1 Tax=Sulfurimonas sp. TaxID=2022749 RepID=UPI0035679AFD